MSKIVRLCLEEPGKLSLMFNEDEDEEESEEERMSEGGKNAK